MLQKNLFLNGIFIINSIVLMILSLFIFVFFPYKEIDNLTFYFFMSYFLTLITFLICLNINKRCNYIANTHAIFSIKLIVLFSILSLMARVSLETHILLPGEFYFYSIFIGLFFTIKWLRNIRKNK